VDDRSIFLYWSGVADLNRDEVEDIIQEALGDDGEVTGGGAGMNRVNIDVEIYDADRSALVFRRVSAVVATIGLPDNAYWKWEYADTPIPVRTALDT
jgi:hypothetical protein